MAAPLVSQLFLLATLVLYARFISMDADGLLAQHKVPPVKDRHSEPSGDRKSASGPSRRAAATQSTAGHQASREAAASLETPSGESSVVETRTAWVDGSEPILEEYDDDGSSKQRKLSKSERKRLRRQKMRRDRRAA